MNVNGHGLNVIFLAPPQGKFISWVAITFLSCKTYTDVQGIDMQYLNITRTIFQQLSVARQNQSRCHGSFIEVFIIHGTSLNLIDKFSITKLEMRIPYKRVCVMLVTMLKISNFHNI